MMSRRVSRRSEHADALPNCAGPIGVVALGLGLGAPVGLALLPAGAGLATLGLTFAAPALGLRLGLVVAAPAFWLRFTVLRRGASIGSVLKATLGEEASEEGLQLHTALSVR
jgi:hypothetical protein